MIILSLNDRNLARQPLFWISALSPFLFFIFLGYFSWRDYSFELSKDAYDNFMTISKFPLLILSLSVPLVAIVAHIHRTIQTEKQIIHTQDQIANTQKQIALLEEKNKPDSYYAHVKSITEALTLIPSFKINRTKEVLGNIKKDPLEVSIKYPHPLYKRIFSKSTIKGGYNPEVSDEFIKSIENKYSQINKIIKHAKYRQDEEGRLRSARTLTISLLLLSSELSLNYRQDGHMFTIATWGSTEKFMTSFASEDEMKDMIKGARSIIIYLYQFLDIDFNFLSHSSEDGSFINQYINSDEYLFAEFFPVSKHNPVELYIKNGGNMAAEDENSC
ncbi:TPA: hypothetical protein LLS86_004549 [Serratia liquefaciens]|nr:hypothetical protein [Serratia liquefaciens]